MNDSAFPNSRGLLKTGVFSLFFHFLLLSFLILSLWQRKDEPVVYHVTLQTFFHEDDSTPKPIPVPVPVRPHVQKKKERTPEQSIKQTQVPVAKKDPDPEIEPPAQHVAPKIPPEEQKEPPKPQEYEQAPIPLPVGELSPSDKNLTSKMEANIPVRLAPVRPDEKKRNIIPGTGYGDGSGRGGSGNGGSGDGSGTGGGGMGEGSGSGSGPGGFAWAGSGRSAGMGGGGGSGGRGTGDGSGTGREGSGGGGSGGDGTGGGGSGGYGTALLIPKYGENAKPVYPREARANGYKGTVLLRVEVLSNGRVGQIEVKESCGYEILDRSALSAVKEWKFIPAKKGGIAIQAWVIIPIKFDLQ